MRGTERLGPSWRSCGVNAASESARSWHRRQPIRAYPEDRIERAAASRGTGASDPYLQWFGESALFRLRRLHAQRCADSGPLAGTLVSVKDHFGVTGVPTFAGTGRPLPTMWSHEGTLVRALRQSGAILIGKTHAGELALGGLGLNQCWGTRRNPWSLQQQRVTGGSSSGAALSVLEQSAEFALGSDTGGSVRVPASMTATVGLKLTWGRWPNDGLVPLAASFDSPGLLAASVAGVLGAFRGLEQTLRGVDPGPWAPCALETLRLGVDAPTLNEDTVPVVFEVVETALRSLERRGAQLVKIGFPAASMVLEAVRTQSYVAAECANFLRHELQGWEDSVGPFTRNIIREGGALEPADILERQRRVAALLRAPIDDFTRCDLIVSPTVPIQPPTHAEICSYEVYRRLNSTALRNTVVANLLGLCAITLPVGLDSSGLPVGLQLMAPARQEQRLLAAALAIEQTLGTAAQNLGRPPQCFLEAGEIRT